MSRKFETDHLAAELDRYLNERGFPGGAFFYDEPAKRAS